MSGHLAQHPLCYILNIFLTDMHTEKKATQTGDKMEKNACLLNMLIKFTKYYIDHLLTVSSFQVCVTSVMTI